MANDKKSELLGLNYSSASSSLRKQIIFHLAGALGLLACHQCGEEIELERFSIEHKDPWMQADDPKASFFDMNNIAFSHLSCNSRASYYPNRDKTHCPQGHEYTGNNLYRTNQGWRQCKMCNLEKHKPA
jgi:hypothetical protein